MAGRRHLKTLADAVGFAIRRPEKMYRD